MKSLKRQSGILMHITSLPNSLGLGCFSSECYKFVDFMRDGGFKCWQVLPFEDCGYGESPYSSSSAFAINPYFIDITEFLNSDEIASLNFNKNNPLQEESVKFDKAHQMIYDKFKNHFDRTEFEKKNKKWLDDYAMFVVLKNIYKVSWNKFPEGLRDRVKLDIEEFKLKNAEDIDRIKFLQYVAEYQWTKIRNYAKGFGIEMFGDMAMYVEFDSADVWSNPKEWEIENCQPKLVAGVPPDYFNQNGQLWGNPIYNYKAMEKNKYSFWVRRIDRTDDLFDLVRIDHFIAFSRYWEVPASHKTAKNGKWQKGAGAPCLNEIIRKTNATLVAEDLGIVTKEVIELKEQFGIPGVKLLQYAFDGDSDNIYKPHNYEKNCVAYIGTHDNDTLMGILSEGNWDKINRYKRYFQMPLERSNEELVDNAILSLYRSSANLIILMTQDILKLGKEGRMNVPGTIDGNWLWQLQQPLDSSLTHRYRELSFLYGR